MPGLMRLGSCHSHRLAQLCRANQLNLPTRVNTTNLQPHSKIPTFFLQRVGQEQLLESVTLTKTA